MELKVTFALIVIALTILQKGGVNSEYTITDCDSFRDVYETFSSCAVFALYNTSERNTVLFDKDVLDRQDLINVVNYWCSLLELASMCTNGGALQCSNRIQIASMVSQTGGVCKSGKMTEAFKRLIPTTYKYNTRCMSKSLDVTEVCEANIPEIEYDASLDEGVSTMRSIIEDVLDCNSKQLSSFADDCVGSLDSILFFTLRSLTLSVPHAIGVDLPVSTVLDIVDKYITIGRMRKGSP